MGAGRPAPGAPRRCRLPRSRRIRRSNEIRDLLRRGKRRKTAHLDVFLAASPVAHPRVGIVVPRHGHSVVERNRLQRRLREILRVEVLARLGDAGCARDVLVRARAAAYEAGFGELREELAGLADELCSKAL